MSDAPVLPDGLVVVVKRDCETCQTVVPALREMATGAQPVTIYTQDDPDFPGDPAALDDTELAVSWHHDIETVPTLIVVVDGVESERTIGWSRAEWRRLTGIGDLGRDLPEMRPGCGSMSVDPDSLDALRARFEGDRLVSRRIEFAALEDPFEAAFERGWSDGLPVVPPTPERVLAMLHGTSRAPEDVVAIVPPDLHEATVEQIAVNAVMAGCRPEYLPVVLSLVEAACGNTFNVHGLLATTYFSGPIGIVNGPIADRIGLNSGGNLLGQGNRANLTIGRALQLVVRNLGGGRPGEVDMALMGSPSKLGLCFAEREHDSPFAPLAADRGLEPGADAITVFAGHGPTAVTDQLSRDPDSLARSMAAVLAGVGHPKLVIGMDALLIVGPEHGRIFREAGWDRSRLEAELRGHLLRPTDDLIQGAGGIAEGLPEALAGSELPKFRDGGLLIVHGGGDAGLFSAVMGGWVGGAKGSEPVTRPITA